MKSIVVGVYAKGDDPAEIGGAGGHFKLGTENGIRVAAGVYESLQLSSLA
jgi:hypothetical protein